MDDLTAAGGREGGRCIAPIVNNDEVKKEGRNFHKLQSMSVVRAFASLLGCRDNAVLYILMSKREESHILLLLSDFYFAMISDETVFE